jgi:tetratricopeptide (TPR) repeat protein
MTTGNDQPSVAALGAQAAALMRNQQTDAAMDAYRALLSRAPGNAEAWYNLGYLQRQAREFGAALESYGSALAHGITSPEDVFVNRAVILLEHLGHEAEAEEELRSAIAVNSRFLPAWLNLGLLYEDRGDRRAARAAYAEAIALDPSNGRALARLANIDVADGKAADAVARLGAVLASPGLADEDSAEIGFALGNALDAIGQYDTAFSVIAEANRVALSLIPPSQRYRPDLQDKLIDDFIRAFPAGGRKTAATGEAPPIFICGMFRSGSTLCERLLARHPSVTAGGELETIPAMVMQRLQPYPVSVAGLTDSAIAELRQAYLRDVGVQFPHAGRLTDKRCDNVLHIGLIKMLFPEAKIIHTRRHALDNILSVYFLYFHDTISYGFSLEDAVHYYKSYRRLMDHWRSVYGDDIIDFDYDAVVRDPEPQMRRLLAFCDLEPDAACLAGQPAEGIVRTASAWQVRQPLHSRSSERWRHYAPQLAQTIVALNDY